MSMIKLACFGENCVDINYIDGRITPGGNSVNVAVYCSQLGHRAAYVGTMGDDRYGDLIRASMNKFGIDYSMIKIAHGETEKCVCRLVNGDRNLSIENGGGVLFTDPIVIDERYIEYFKRFDIIHANYWAYLDDELMKLGKIGVPICYDFSQAWEEERVEKAAKFAKYILFSGKKNLGIEDNLNSLRHYVDTYGIELGIMTFGIAGAYVYDGTELYYKEPYNVEGGAIDTTGCGDSWIGGFITTYLECMKRLNDSIARVNNKDLFLTAENINDYHKWAISMAMSTGNMRARETCGIPGAYGCGISIEEFEKNKKQ